MIEPLQEQSRNQQLLSASTVSQLALNRDERWNYRTSKPSKLVTVKGCRKHMKTEAFSGGLYRQNLITEILRTNICKYKTITFNSNMWISLMRNLANNGNQPRNPHFHSEIHHLHVRRSLLDQPWMTKLQHLQTIQTCHCQRMSKTWDHDMPQHSAILRSPSHTPGLGALVANLVVSQTDFCDGRVCLQRLGQGLETETDQGWRLHPGLYRSNRDHWNPENTWHLTLTCESLWYRTLQTKQKSTVAYSIYIFDVTTLLEQRWMMKRQDLQTIQTCHCQRMSKTYENKSIQRWALPSKPDHWNPENKYMQI